MVLLTSSHQFLYQDIVGFSCFPGTSIGPVLALSALGSAFWQFSIRPAFRARILQQLSLAMCQQVETLQNTLNLHLQGEQDTLDHDNSHDSLDTFFTSVTIKRAGETPALQNANVYHF